MPADGAQMRYQVDAVPMALLKAAPLKDPTVMVCEAPPETKAQVPMFVALAMVLPVTALLVVT